MKLTIKQKLYLLAICVVLALCTLFFAGRIMLAKQDHLTSVASANAQLQIDMLMLRRNEKDFLMRQDLKYLDKFDGNMKKAESSLALMLDELSYTSLSNNQALALRAPLQEYKKQFHALVSATEEKGLDKDLGHYGKLRRATHDLEKHLNAQNNDRALVLLLTLRRHEKDFILRSDSKYVTRLESTAAQLQQLLSADNQASVFINRYVTEFNAFHAISQQIGLSEKEGIRGQMRGAVHKLESSLKSLSSYYDEAIEDSLATTQIVKVFISLSISIAITLGIILIARQIIFPIEHLSRSFEDIRKSDDLTKRIEILRDDEIGAASKDFNILIDYFHNTVQKINTSVAKLESATSIVSQSVHNTQNSIDMQATQSDMVATAVTEMGATANDIAKNAESTAETVNQANQSAQLGTEKVQQTIERVNVLADSLVAAGDSMNLLKEKSDGITSVLDVIKGIAEQTNLLALNAAIEAARAGEQGRGFAVVADEVRTLAIRTQDSTAEITNIINELQSSTSNIAGIVEQCKDAGVDSAEMAKEAGDVLQEIISEMQVVNQMSTEIATAVEEQSNVVEEINSNVMQITDLGEEISKESGANAKATNDVSEQASLLHDTVNIFKV